MDNWISIEKKDFEEELERIQLLMAQSDQKDDGFSLELVRGKLFLLWEKAESQQQKVECINLATLIQNDEIRNGLLWHFSRQAYNEKNYYIAFWGFLRGAQTGDIDAKNSLGYMIRRHEYSCKGIDVAYVTLNILFQGLKQNESYSVVNTALVLCLLLGEDKDWKIADNLFEELSPNQEGVSSWWLSLEDDVENYLVHFFLLRHKKISNCLLGSIKGIVHKLEKELESFPEWLAKDYSITTLDDVIECMGDSDFDSILDEFLESMPFSRDSADKMLRILSDWDLLPVYLKLLTEYMSLLSQDEVAKLKSDYKEKFSIPLPDETE